MFFFLNPTLFPVDDFDASIDAATLREAMQGRGTDEDIITEILTTRSNKQRRLIEAVYKDQFDRDLKDDLKEELGGNYEKLILALMYRPIEFLCKEIHSAIKGLGTDEETLIEILCSRDNFAINKIVNFYEAKYGKCLAEELAGETSGNLRRLLLPIVTGTREGGIEVDEDQARQDAADLFNAGEARWGTEESVFARIFGTHGFRHLKKVFDEYESLAGNTIEEAVKDELSGDLKDAMLAIVQCVDNTAKYHARRLRKAMKGLGTEDDILIRIIATRCEMDLGNIKEEYEKRYEKSLKDAVESETKGDYGRAIIKLIK